MSPITRPTLYRVECPSNADREVTGFDSAILVGPADLLVMPDHEVPIVMKLGSLSHMFASSVGDRLHHANWRVTTDPAVVEEMGRPGCRHCRAGFEVAKAHLLKEPGRPMVVGQLFYAGSLRQPVFVGVEPSVN